MVVGPVSGLPDDGVKGVHDTDMTCPHCLRGATVRLQNATFDLPASKTDESVTYVPKYGYCPSPECGRLVMLIERAEGGRLTDRTVLPATMSVRRPEGVPRGILDDYVEAAQVVEISPNASAALARRCLQATVQSLLGRKGKCLSAEVEEFRNSGLIPHHLKGELDMIRILGNDAAHPTQDSHTGLIVKTDPGDARWLLRVLEDLFQYCFVAPKEYERNGLSGRKGGARA